MQQRSKRVILVNTFGSLGYLSVLFQWSWSALVLSYPLIVARPEFLFPKDQPLAATITTDTSLSPLMIVIALAVTAAVLAIATIVLIRLPKTIGQQAAKLTHSTAQSVVPIIAHRKKISKKKMARLSYRVILIIKLFLVILPLLALIFAQPIEHISIEVIWAMAAFCAILSLAYFLMQLGITQLARIDTELVW